MSSSLKRLQYDFIWKQDWAEFEKSILNSPIDIKLLLVKSREKIEGSYSLVKHKNCKFTGQNDLGIYKGAKVIRSVSAKN